MDRKMTDALWGVSGKWLWFPPFLARVVVGIFFIQTGLTEFSALRHTEGILNSSWISVLFEHSWDPLFPAAELIFGAFMLLGCLTRFSAVLLFGIMAVSFLDVRLRGLAGLNLFAFQEYIVMILLLGLSAAGAGTVSLDRFIFKHKATAAD